MAGETTKELRERIRCYAREWREKNPDKCAEYSRQYRKRNRAVILERQKKWREEHPDKALALKRAWEKNNPEKVFAMKQRWRKKHAAKIRERNLRYQRANRDKTRAWSRKHYAANVEEYHDKVMRRRSKIPKGARLSRGLTKRLYDQQGGLCNKCRCKLHASGYHRDHIIPLAKGGKHEDANIQLLCPPCNLSKGAKIPTP